jgi:hypothetical protein
MHQKGRGAEGWGGCLQLWDGAEPRRFYFARPLLQLISKPYNRPIDLFYVYIMHFFEVSSSKTGRRSNQKEKMQQGQTNDDAQAYNGLNIGLKLIDK